ncbi:NUDIX domain-containing protein [Brevibacillus laterosporus]|uniref:NUDIX domain-containing protein n=1 Tax=Brevibacillus laterosporus TaxID=1465 RepID=UPI00264F4153|nr:NUDIX domain-containing protein [Brevibacillus laterosporus]MDN9011750.1 NUDIX domain-containing protein [Brevibacillus laterosporus]MDO0942750.1 NUDIX domain-containing protein [Brevibacillus laterosporus]
MRESKVWLAAGGIVVKGDEVLVVKKTYGGLKGKWSFPAGFVEPNETVDEAAVREVLEETGIVGRVRQVAALRTGVIREEISDNMIVFLMDYVEGDPQPQEGEIEVAAFMPINDLLADPLATEYIQIILPHVPTMSSYLVGESYVPDPIFGYSSYKIFT